jgi:hypothetical protein
MKHLFISAMFMMSGFALSAQNDCNKNHPVYNMDNTSAPKSVYRLGTDPEFPFLRNLTTSRQVLAALKSSANRKKYPRQMKEMDRMLREIGFENGVKDVKLSSISAISVPAGTSGNMGNGKLNYAYVEIKGKPKKAWEISAGNGCYISFLSTCGNAFYAGDNFGANRTKSYTGCKDIPVNISSEEKEITINDTPEHHVIKKTYIYYKKDGCGCFSCDDPDKIYGRSRPLLVKKEDITEQVPQTYKVITTGTGTATVCNGKPTDVHADITVEKEAEYTGYRPPEVQKEYIEVSKREYKRTLRMKERATY